MNLYLFKLILLLKAIWRDCAKNVWLPDTIINQTNTCVNDPYSNELFCNCDSEDLCNKDNTGNRTVYG